ncbi:MAG: enoyl-ACP reductase [Gammaproteobacteria bacterium]|jgi:enoyl-[acyl-carrier protein] reductase I|nr:enoyl-ACP reductase [Gammaproteobacteria bacterium]MBT3490490.1 enoyl-ACP reductase [Gammaproteobacteria bacterium]MBT3717352.1 enoyl-ACP reductase [Gammaproteobacteria bacterium]MBT3844601.1 enoyl-ACP reductase [Gammaproteobacteria bacterium]MBT3894370.1 enoyl-ACP reductase [Gammaproteobacteria bacterium]
MGFMQGKKALIIGVASNRSIAWGIAKAMHREGAEIALTYQGEKLQGRAQKFAAELDSNIAIPCDVGSDEDISNTFKTLAEHWDGLDCLVHSVAYSPKGELDGRFVDSVTREGSMIAHDISSYSFAALAREALPMMAGRNGSMLTLSYLGAIRSIPHYNIMGLAKASLEACVRALAADLGPDQIRVNGLSAGPIKTLAAKGIGDFNLLLDYSEKNSPLRRNVTIDEVGNVGAFLCSDLASGMTGEITYVDGGYNTTGMATYGVRGEE